MAEASTPAPKAAANPVPHQGDHDRVAMLSVKADGTADQHNPEVILDAEAATEATRRQFVDQAVSAADVELAASRVSGPVTIIGKPGDEPDEIVPATADAVGEDPSIAEARKVTEAAAKAAGAAAERAVKALTKDA